MVNYFDLDGDGNTDLVLQARVGPLDARVFVLPGIVTVDPINICSHFLKQDHQLIFFFLPSSINQALIQMNFLFLII